MASLWSSADWACMACSWCAADIGGGRPPGSSRGYGVPGGDAKNDLILKSGRDQIDRLDVISLLMTDGIGGEPTEDWVAQHFVFMWLAEERVRDGAGWVREAGQVRSSCQGIYCQGMGPRTWRTHKTFTTTFWVSESSVQGTLISR